MHDCVHFHAMHSKNINDRRGHPNAKKRLKRADIEDNEIKEIERILKEETQPSGANPGNVSRKDDGTPTQRGLLGSRKFEELPISRYTKNALKKGKFVTMTAIQRAVLPHALVGRDVLGAAKTGSGKTLAFLIPVRPIFVSSFVVMKNIGLYACAYADIS